MLRVFYGIIALVAAFGGVFVVYEAVSYTDEQRARAPRYWLAFAGSGAALCLVGVGTIAWLLVGGDVPSAVGVLVLATALPSLVQALLHRRLDAERSPLLERLSRVAARRFGDSQD